METARRPGRPPSTSAVANHLHAAAVHLLRRIRETDRLTGLSPSRLSALSVLVFGEPCTISDLADAEEVSVPTMSRLVAALEADGLVERHPDPDDGRAVLVSATPAGARILLQGRRERVEYLAELLDGLHADDLVCLDRASALIERTMRASED